MGTKHGVILALAVAAAMAPATGAAAGIINVPGDQPTIQAGIVAAVDGDEIVVAPGVYNEAINTLGKAITVRSSGGPGVTTINATGLNTSVVTCNSLEGSDTVLDGFTITGGNAVEGGGMVNDSSSPTVTNCIFEANEALHGGGLFNRDSSAMIANCTFRDNMAGGFGGSGGGMHNFQSNPVVVNCSFENNITFGGPAKSNGCGGGMANRLSNPTVVNCTFTGNAAFGFIPFGGGMDNIASSPTVINCAFIENRAEGFIGVGGGLANVGAADHVKLSGCIFIGNEAAIGGGMHNQSNIATLRNCTLSGNVASFDGGGIYGNSGTTFSELANCVVYGNIGGQIVNFGTAVTLAVYSDVEGGWPGLGNIDADPLFVDPLNGDYRLGAGSPSIDAGHNWAVPGDSADLDGDTDTTELTPLDLDGNPRFADDVATTDTGCGATAIVDMGAYEFPGNALDCLRPGDVNGDGTVNVLDLIELLLTFGASCEDACCLADFDLSGSVDVLDLIDLLLAFGTSCP